MEVVKILLSDYGLIGALATGLIALLWWMMKEHKSERKDWKGTYEKNAEAMTNLNSTLSEIKGMLRK